MNKVNGYCQIELPDRIALSDLTSQLTLLTKDEARSIIDNLGLGSIKLSPNQDERDAIDYHPIIRDALITKPLFIISKGLDVSHGKTIVLGNVVEDLADGDAVNIYACVGQTPVDCKYIHIYIDFERIGDVNACPTIYDIPISIHARNITNTSI